MYIANSRRILLCRLVRSCYCVRVNKTGNVCTNVIFKRVRVTILAVKKAEIITYSECVSVALLIKYPKRMRRILLYHIFAHFLANCTILGKVTEHKMCTSETFSIVRRIQRDISTNVHRSPCKAALILVRL